LIKDHQTGFVVFTGSVPGGQQIQAATATRFINTTLELGGKDPAYVCDDSDVEKSAFSVVDGAVYNAGQSCCAVERCYVHEKVAKRFVECCVENFKTLQLGDPKNDKTNIGPMASPSAPQFLQKQVEQAVAKGAKILYGSGKACTDATNRGRFFSPTLLTNCNHTMDVMQEESFGPVLPICVVKSDKEAVQLMNDSKYGLTAAVYTGDEKRADLLSRQIETGTVFMNRCDYLDPYLAWTGVKDTGKGVSLSKHCFEYFIKLKSLNFKVKW
ncbi:putative aldehyde dehydrogenase, partial [Reticulomyxa filosa]